MDIGANRRTGSDDVATPLPTGGASPTASPARGAGSDADEREWSARSPSGPAASSASASPSASPSPSCSGDRDLCAPVRVSGSASTVHGQLDWDCKHDGPEDEVIPGPQTPCGDSVATAPAPLRTEAEQPAVTLATSAAPTARVTVASSQPAAATVRVANAAAQRAKPARLRLSARDTAIQAHILCDDIARVSAASVRARLRVSRTDLRLHGLCRTTWKA